MSNTFQIVEIGLIPAVGISTTLTRSQHENSVTISDLWKRFNKDIYKIVNRPPSGMDWEKFGITYAQSQQYFYLAAIPYLGDMRVPSHMVRKNIARGRYACISHTGKMSGLKSTIHNIYKNILPQSNLTLESPEKAGLIHFERYDYRFHWNRRDSIIEVYVPIETVTQRGRV